MIHQTEPLERRIQAIHLPIIKDPSYIGTDIHDITDIELLTEWWEAGQWLDDSRDTSFKSKCLREIHGSIWIQINALHPKTLLTFKDILINETDRTCKS